jgi:hypothetical protein
MNRHCRSLWLLLTVALLLLCSAVRAESAKEMSTPKVFAKSSFLGDDGSLSNRIQARVSERVSLLVDIYTDTWFSSAPRVMDFRVDGAIVVRTEKFATNFSERIKGQRYTVQRWEYHLFPQRAGQMVVPGIEVKVEVKAETAGSDDNSQKPMITRSNPLAFSVAPLPANAERNVNSQRVLSSANVNIEESYSSSALQMQVGDVLERRVEVAAEDTLAMLIPGVAWPEIHGVRQQASRERLQDRDNRGRMQAKRSEVRSYIFQRPGTFTLPPIFFQWWDPQQQVWQQYRLPPRDITVISAVQSAAWSQKLQWLLDDVVFGLIKLPVWLQALGVILLVLLMAVGLFGARIRRALASFWDSEKILFGRLWLVSCFYRPQSILQCYYAWLAKREADGVSLDASIMADVLAPLYKHHRDGVVIRWSQRRQWLSQLWQLRARASRQCCCKHKSLPPLNPK